VISSKLGPILDRLTTVQP